MEQEELPEQRQRTDRKQRRERLARVPELTLEAAAAIAHAQVPPDQRRGPPPKPLGHLRELDPHLLAGQQPRLGRLGKRDSRADEQGLDARDRRLHRLRDLVIRHGVHLAQDERSPLRLGKVLDVSDQHAELLAVVNLVGGAGAVIREVDIHRVHPDRLDPTQVVETPVARDPVQPWPHVDWAIVGEDRVESGGHDLLEDILRVLARAQEVAAESQQPWLVARDEHFERGGAAAAGQGDQALVGLQSEQGRTPVQSDSSGVSKR